MCLPGISLCSMANAGVHSTSSRRLIFGILCDRFRGHWDEFVHYQRRANEDYAEARSQFSVRSRVVLMNTQCHHKWWSTLKLAVFGSSSDSSVPPLIGAGGVLVWSVSLSRRPKCWRPILMESSQGTLEIGHAFPNLTTSAFSSLGVRRLLLGLDSYGGTDLLGQLMFWPLVSLFYFSSFFVSIALPFAGKWLISPQFQRVHHPLHWQITDQFP